MEDYYQSETTVRKNGESEHKMQSLNSASRSGEKKSAKGGRTRATLCLLPNLKTIATCCRMLAVMTVMVLQCGTAWGQAKPDNSKNVKFAKTTAVPAKADKKGGKAKVATMEAVKRSAAKTTESGKQAKPAKQNPENLPEFKESWKNNTGIFSRYHANKWKSGGLYSGLSPEQELTQYRTEHSKTFDNGDGTNSYMYIGDLHYKDAQGSWQDIEVDIEKVNNGQYRYANTKNKFQTYYSDSPSEGIKMKYLGQSLVFAKDYRFEFIDEQGQAIKGNDCTAQNARQADYRTLSYQNFYNGIDYSIIQLGRGVETGFSVNNRNAVADGSKTVRISQTVELPQGAYIVVDGKKQGNTFRASEFEVLVPGHDSWIAFQPVVVYDAHVDMDYIMKRAEIRHEGDKYDKEGKPVEDPMAKHSYKAMYSVSQSGSTLTVSFDLPAEWLLASERAYPLFIDPTVTVLTGTTSVTSSYTFYNTYYHDSRWDVQITDAEMSAAGIANGATISACGLLCSAAPGLTVANARIDLNNSAWTTNAWVTGGWTTCYYTASLATPTVSTTTWNTYTFQTNFTYSNANSNLLVRLSKDGSDWSSGGGNYCVSNSTGTTARGGYQDNSAGWPFNSIGNQSNACRPAMQLTYTNVNSSCSHTDQTVGTHTNGIYQRSPVAPDYNYSYTQTIYTPDEVCGSGTGADLYGIAFYYYGRSTSGTGGDIVRNVTIYLSETTNDQLSNWETTGLTQVFSGNVAFIKGSWTWITFNTPFSYSGNNNLVITVNDQSGHNYWDGTGEYCYFYTENMDDDGTPRSRVYYNDDTPVINPNSPPGSSSWCYWHPYTKFCIECNSSCDSTITMDNLTANIVCGTEYCFYDDGGRNGAYASLSGSTQTATFNSCGDITINFSEFETESSSGCNDWDYIKIYDGTAESGTQLVWGQSDCSSRVLTIDHDYTATSGKMTVVWKSDGSVTAAGWEATITAANCCTNPTLSGCPVGNMVSGGTATLGTSCGTITSCSSSNTSVATVTSDGVITAKAPGSATITATITKGTCTYSKTCPVTVICNSGGGNFSISQTSGSVQSGNDITATITNTTGQTINWTTNNGNATVSQSGSTLTIHGVSLGTTIITGTIPQWTSGGVTYCQKTVTYTVTVNCNSGGGNFSLSSNSGSVMAGNDITATVTNTTGQTINWITNNGNATVSQSGSTLTIHGVSEGSTTITGTIPQWTGSDGVTYCQKQVTYTVNVTDGCVKIVNSTPTASSSGTYGGIYTWTNTIAYTQQLYTKAELNAAGVTCAGELTSIALNYQETTSSALTFDVYIGQTSQSTVPTSWITDANLALGYSGTTTFNTGWNSIDVSGAHFTWDGTSNIVVAIMRTSGTSGAVSYPDFYHTNTSNMMVYLTGATLNGNHVATANGSSNVQRPEMKFCISCCTPRSGTFEYATTSHTITAGTTYTNTTLNNQTGASVTRYEIYPTGQGATINASSGQVSTTAGTDGTFTITAIIEGGSTYCDKATSYTLTVNDGCSQVGMGTAAYYYTPVYSSTSYYSYSQQLYTASQITETGACRGMINSIKFHYTSASSLTVPIEVYIGSTNSNNLTSAWISDADLMAVYASPAGGTTFSTGWVELALTTPFYWDGESNILVAVRTTGTSSMSSGYFEYTSFSSPYLARYAYNSGSEIAIEANNVAAATGSYSSYRPNIRFCIDCCTERTGTAGFDFCRDALTIDIGSSAAITMPVEGTDGVSPGGTVSYSSSNSSVATVSSDGTVTGVANGSATITATMAYDDPTGYCPVSAKYNVQVGPPAPCFEIGTETSNNYYPIPGWYGWQYDVYIYTPTAAPELNNNLNITSIAYYITSTNATSTSQMTVWVKDVDPATTLATGTTFATYINGASQVYNNTSYSAPNTGWQTLDFSSSFSHTGGQALLVAVRGVGCSTTGGCSRYCRYTSATGTHWYRHKDNNDPGTTTTTDVYIDAQRANIKLCYESTSFTPDVMPTVEITNASQPNVCWGNAITNMNVTASDDVTFSPALNTLGLNYNSSTNVISGTPNFTGSRTVTVTVTSDDGCLKSTKDLSITVNELGATIDISNP